MLPAPFQKIIWHNFSGIDDYKIFDNTELNPADNPFRFMENVDEDTKFEKVFCCLSARAKDFAKFGRLYLHKGNWNGKQIVSEDWIKQSTQVDTIEGSVWNYQYMLWIVSKERNDCMAVGHLGQFVYVYPDKNIVIVRFGENDGEFARKDWTELFALLGRII